MPGLPAAFLFYFLKPGDGAYHPDLNQGGDYAPQWDNYAGPGCRGCRVPDGGGRDGFVVLFLLIFENICLT